MNNSTEPIGDFKRFDTQRPPRRQAAWLLPVAWLLSFPSCIRHRAKITRVGMKGLRPPYLLLCNHNSFYDFKVTTAAVFPHRANYVVAMDGFIGREWLMRLVGCICKRKFTNSLTLVRHLQRVVKNGDIAGLYPEARYSLCGTQSELPESLGKLARLLKVPVVTLIMNGHHIDSPFWNIAKRGNRTEAVMTKILTAEEVSSLTAEQINARINAAFVYDDFAWQRDNRVRITYKKRAEGLHRVLYQCAACGAQYRMTSAGVELSCSACGAVWRMNEYGELEGPACEHSFTHIPDWYEWQRGNVRAEVEAGKYGLSVTARIDTLPNSHGFIKLGKGTLTHNMDGFTLTGVCNGEPFELKKSVPSQYACHIECNYLRKGADCIDLSTLDDTFFIFPDGSDFSVTKIALATEELYRLHRARQSAAPASAGE